MFYDKYYDFENFFLGFHYINDAGEKLLFTVPKDHAENPLSSVSKLQLGADANTAYYSETDAQDILECYVKGNFKCEFNVPQPDYELPDQVLASGRKLDLFKRQKTGEIELYKKCKNVNFDVRPE